LQEIEQKIHELKSVDHDLRKEIVQRKHEIKTLNEELEKQTRQNQLITEELDNINDQTNMLQVSVSNSCNKRYEKKYLKNVKNASFILKIKKKRL